MDRDEIVKELSSRLKSNIDDFYAFKEGTLSLNSLCKILAKEFLNFNIIRQQVRPEGDNNV